MSRRVQRVRDLDSEQWQSVQLQRAGANHVLHSLTIQELHHEERLAAILADVVSSDVGMVESRRSLRFTSSIRESVSR